MTDIDEYDILIACEFSGTVRDAFRGAGYSAISCDLRDSEAAEAMADQWGPIFNR